MILSIFFFFLLLWQIQDSNSETVSGCTINNNQYRRTNQEKTSVTLSCANNGFILVRNLTFGVHKSSTFMSSTPTCSYQPGDCTTRTTFIGMECNGLTSCNLDLNPQYLHICSQYSDYMVLDYSCLQGPSLSVCDYQAIKSSYIDEQKEYRLFLRSPNYPNEYENSLNCSCQLETKQSKVKFLDFYLEERDEMNLCSRDRLQINNRSFCGSTSDDQKQLSSPMLLDTPTKLTFKSNDVITRKGFWLMLSSDQPLQVSCSNLMDVTLPIPTTTTTTMTMTTTVSSTTTLMRMAAVTTLSYSIFTSSASTSNTDSSRSTHKRRHALSYILLLTIIVVVVLLLMNLILMILCWKQRRTKKSLESKANGNNRPFFCSLRSSSSASSSMTYGETPVLTSLDTSKPSSSSTRYIFPPNSTHIDTTPSASMTTTTTATGPYEDLHDSSTLSKSKSSNDHSLYMQQRHIPTIPVASPHAGYNRMIHFPPPAVRCHFSTPAQTFYPPQPIFDSQHIYETIQDGQHCPYQRLAATLRRPIPAAPSTCTCYYEHSEANYPPRTHPTEEINPETLV